MAESKVKTGPDYGKDPYARQQLQDMADTEFVVDLIGYGDDSAYGLAERGIRAMQRTTLPGELWERVRNLGADLGPDKSMEGIAAVYNTNPKKSKHVTNRGSRGLVRILPRSILLNPDASVDTIRHELAHHGFETIRPSFDDERTVVNFGEKNVVPVPMDALSRVLEKDASSDAEHLLIESLEASNRLKAGRELSEKEIKLGRSGFDDIARYMNEPSKENSEQALRRIQRALSKPLWNNLFDQTVVKTAEAVLKEDGVFNEKKRLDYQILPYQLLDSLMQASMNFNTKPDAGQIRFEKNRFESGGAVGGVAALPVDNKMINPEILSQIERIMGR